jgi:hypothetical protein
VGLAALQRDLDRAYADQGRLEVQINELDMRIKTAEARGEAAVVAALQPQFDLQMSSYKQSMDDIEAIRHAMQNTTYP